MSGAVVTGCLIPRFIDDGVAEWQKFGAMPINSELFWLSGIIIHGY